MMRKQIGLVSLATPAVLGAALYAADVPTRIMAKVEAEECILPDDFQIQNFTGVTLDGGDSLDSFDFTFFDDSTLLETKCYLNESSVPIELPDRPTARWPCENDAVQFIWDNMTLTMIEAVCPGADGEEDFETSGTVPTDSDEMPGLALECESVCSGDGQICEATNSNITARFFSLNPVPSVPATAGE